MQKVDFLPERIREQRARRGRLIRQGHLVLLVLAGLAVLGWLRHSRVERAEAQLTMLEERVGGVRRQLEVRTQLEDEQADLLIKKRIDDQLGSRVTTLDVLAELGRMMPSSINLLDLNIETMEIRTPIRSTAGRSASAGRGPREKVDKRVRLVITGVAPAAVDVANFIGQLSACPIFEDVNMGYAKTVEFRGREAQEFQASCYVVK
jgi:Tfp pilus assembly protein PilN